MQKLITLFLSLLWLYMQQNMINIQCIQLNSNLILIRMSHAETWLIFKFTPELVAVHKHVSDNLWQTTLVRHAKLLE